MRLGCRAQALKGDGRLGTVSRVGYILAPLVVSLSVSPGLAQAWASVTSDGIGRLAALPETQTAMCAKHLNKRQETP